MVHVGKSGEPAELHVKILPIKSLMNLSSKPSWSMPSVKYLGKVCSFYIKSKKIIN